MQSRRPDDLEPGGGVGGFCASARDGDDGVAIARALETSAACAAFPPRDALSWLGARGVGFRRVGRARGGGDVWGLYPGVCLGLQSLLLR